MGTERTHEPNHLFADPARRRYRWLILPRYLDEESRKPILEGPERDRAHKIILRWANLESDGHLARKETSLDAAFLHELFGDALGYTPSTKSPDRYHLERSFTVPGIGTADGALGNFPPANPAAAIAVIELKDADTDLDHDRFNGRTAIQQCWDYLYNLPACPWGIVSNFVSIRLYHRDRTQRAFEHFTLQQLRDPAAFNQFYALFERGGLLPSPLIKTPRALSLLQRSESRQREVGDQLYEYYSEQRLRLIDHLRDKHRKSLDEAIRAAQLLLDRIIFIAFCEQRGLLPENLIKGAVKNVPPLARATNPRWQNFLNIFHAIDKGHPDLDLPTGYNGGLFREDPIVDNLDLEDAWTTVFQNIGDYDFREEVNVDVLGHIFEKSVTELEKLRVGGFFQKANGGAAPAMPKSAMRKRFGIYYTPPAFTSFIVQNTLGEIIRQRFDTLAAKHGVDPDAPPRPAKRSATAAAYHRECLDALRQIAVCDPACGSGAFLIQAYELLEHHYQSVIESLAFHQNKSPDTWLAAVPEMILSENLFGVDLSQEAVEITQLALWIRSARRGQTLADLTRNIVHGNSLVTDPNVHPAAIQWDKTFPGVFGRKDGGFDCVIGNPPWERLKLQEREFFAFSAPQIAGAVSAAQRRKLIEDLEENDPALYAHYLQGKAAAERTLEHIRSAGQFPLTGKGDVNTYMVFAELASRIVRPTGRVGLLVPSGIATDDTTKEFFTRLMDTQALVSLYDFENKEAIFPDVHRSFKFSAIVFGGGEAKTPAADFVFFARNMQQLTEKDRHIPLSAKDLALLNPNTRTCPIFRTRRDADLTKAIYRRIPILIDENRKTGGNPWGIRFVRMFDQTNDAELFIPPNQLKQDGFRLDGNRWVKGKKVFLPLYEAKMVQAYDHRAASVRIEEGNWVRQGQTDPTTLVEHQNPEFVVLPRWWVAQDAVAAALRDDLRPAYLAYKDVTSPTNQRTMIAAFIPPAGVVNSAPLILTDKTISPRRACCLLANLNSFALDFVARQKVGGVHLNFFIVEQLPILPPDAYEEKCPWNKRQTLETWISDRVLKLTCTADDMRPFADAAGFADKVHKWKDPDRAALRAELDAAYFHLYGLSRDDASYILSTFAGLATEGDDDSPQFDFTAAGNAVLEAYDALAG